MAIFRRCNRCHQLFSGKLCTACANIYDAKRKKQHESLQVYSGYKWKLCRKNVLLKYMGYDIWLLAVGKLYRPDKVIVHHIIERDEDPSKIYDLDNLISTSEASHGEIHEAYKTNKPEAIERIMAGIKAFEEMFGSDS